MSFHSAETFESLLGCLKMEDEKVAEAALQIFKNTGSQDGGELPTHQIVSVRECERV